MKKRNAADLIAKFEAGYAQLGQVLAELRTSVGAEAASNDAVMIEDEDEVEVTDGVDTATAAKAIGRSVARVTTICREYRRSGRFAQKVGGRFKVNINLLRAWFRQRDADRVAKRRRP